MPMRCAALRDSLDLRGAGMTWIRTFVIAALIVGCATGSSAIVAAARTGVAAPASEIVLTRSLGGNTSLYVMASDGSHVRLLVRDASAAAVSPDGHRIAFVRQRAIWLARRDGMGQHKLTQPLAKLPDWARGDADPAWSTDGRTIYFSGSVRVHKAYASAVFAIGVDGKNRRQLTHPRVAQTDMGPMGEAQFSPAPSPDGRLIVFADNYGYGSDQDIPDTLKAMTALGRPAQLAFRLPASPYGYTLSVDAAAWAPDGHRLAYVVNDYTGAPGDVSRSGMFVSSSTGSPPRRLEPEGYSPAWSPDGNWISFTRPDAGGVMQDIWLVRSDGEGLRQLTHTHASESDATWMQAAS
jgi:Tol biopolymer transport system component